MYESIFATKNGINNSNSSCTGYHTGLWIHYVLRLEMIGRVFSVELCGCYPLFYYSLVLLVMRLQPIDNIQVFRNK